jgi:hypothetical protein
VADELVGRRPGGRIRDLAAFDTTLVDGKIYDSTDLNGIIWPEAIRLLNHRLGAAVLDGYPCKSIVGADVVHVDECLRLLVVGNALVRCPPLESARGIGSRMSIGSQQCLSLLCLDLGKPILLGSGSDMALIIARGSPLVWPGRTVLSCVARPNTLLSPRRVRWSGSIL